MSKSDAVESTEVSHAPERASLVLVSLIVVAGVANLNLSVANVALPSIGKAFDSSQTTLDMIAVGYSLGLAASVLYLGAVGDRYGRKMMLILGITLSVPACLLAAYAPNDDVLVVARIFGGLSAGMAYPTTLALITALWSGPGRTKVDRAVVSPGRRNLGSRPAHGRRPPGALLVGVGVPGHPAPGRGGADHGVAVRALARQRVERRGRQPGRHPVGAAGRGPGAGHQLRTGAGQGDAGGWARPDRARSGRRVHLAATAGGQPALRPGHRSAPHVLGGRLCGDHRVRLADGVRLRLPAVPPERAGLRHRRGRRRVPARRSCSWCSWRPGRRSWWSRAGLVRRC